MLDQGVEDYFNLVEQIRKVSARTKADTTGETSAKKKAKEKLARYASGLAASGMAYGFDKADPELEAALGYAYYEIRYAKDAKTLQITGAILEVLLKHQAGLEKYIVSSEHIAELERLRERFSESIKIKGGAKSGKTADVKKLARLFKSCDDLLYRKMDRLLLRLRADHPQFYDAYISARRIIDR